MFGTGIRFADIATAPGAPQRYPEGISASVASAVVSIVSDSPPDIVIDSLAPGEAAVLWPCIAARQRPRRGAGRRDPQHGGRALRDAAQDAAAGLGGRHVELLRDAAGLVISTW
jgi:hypothetical protein